eukprot:IDg1143t1
MAQSNRGSLLGDCRSVLQVGGAGENNLPRRALIELKEEQTKQFLRNVRSLQGEFNDDNAKSDGWKAVAEFARPFCPWAIGYEKHFSSVGAITTVCTCNQNEAPRESEPSPASRVMLRDRARLRQAKISYKNKKSTQRQLDEAKPKPPSGTVVPRLRDLGTVLGVVNCWRKGILPARGTFTPASQVPLYRLATARNRKKVWAGSNDKWWKDSGNKQAFARVRRVMKKVGQYMQGEQDLNVLGSDADWNSAAARCEKDFGSNPHSSLLK